MSNDIQSFLDKIGDIKEKEVSIYIPSLKKEFTFDLLTFKQQKDIIGTIADGTLGAVKLQKIINEVIIDNSKTNTLLTTDKIPVILKLRAASISDSVKIDGNVIELQPYIDKFNSFVVPEDKVITHNGISVIIGVPQLFQENSVINACIDEFGKTKNIQTSKNIGNLYTYEIIKYVKSVAIGDDVIDFRVPTVQNRFKIVENLPISLNKKIVEFIQDIKTQENEFLTIQVGDITKILEIDVSFFDS